MPIAVDPAGAKAMRYRFDTRRVTLREFRTDGSLPQALLAWLVTRLPIRISSSSEFPTCDSLKACVVPPARVPPEVLEVFRQPSDELVALGFRGRVFHAVDEVEQQTSHFQADFVDRPGQTIARLKRRTFRGATPHKQYLTKEFISQTTDGSFLVTSSSKGDLQLPDSIQSVLMPGAGLAELWQVHRKRLQELGTADNFRRVEDARGVVEMLEALHRRVHEHLLGRRVLVPVDENAYAPAHAVAAPLPADAVAPLDGDASQLLNEVRRRETKQTSNPATTALLLLVTAALFIAMGGFAWSWTFTLFLVPILLFHELGHFLCMKMFDYRNVRMFFIPLFGAAVSGQNYNVPGWKRVVTSLMGPLPGIALGIALGIVGLVRGYDVLIQGALIMVVVNGFNLIPALPLDGGWVVHGLLFSRHAFLDLIFRIAAIAMLLLLGIVGGGWVTMGLGVAMIVGLPASFHTARITDRLRGKGDSWVEPNATLIPVTAVTRIAKELDLAYPKGLALKPKATLVLQIYQNVNSPPPGVLGTLTLSSVYLASLAAAVIGGAVIVLGQNSDLGRLMTEVALGPQQKVAPAQIVRRPAGVQVQGLASSEAIVASFPDRAAAEEGLATFQNELGPQRRLVLFGQTLILPLETSDTPEQRDAWFSRLEPLTGSKSVLGEDISETFLDHPEQRAMIQLMCIARTAEEAAKLEEAANVYIQRNAQLRLIPPWDPHVTLTAPQQKARRTVAALTSSDWMQTEEGDEAMDDTNKQLESAQRRGRQAEAKQILEKMYQRQRDQHTAHIEQIRQAGAEYDPEIVDAYQKAYAAEAEKTPADRPVYLVSEDWLNGVADKLGQYDEASPSLKAFGTRHGYLSRNGLILHLHISFESTASGLLAVVDWLNGQGCIDFRYGILPGSAFEE